MGESSSSRKKRAFHCTAVYSTFVNIALNAGDDEKKNRRGCLFSIRLSSSRQRFFFFCMFYVLFPLPRSVAAKNTKLGGLVRGVGVAGMFIKMNEKSIGLMLRTCSSEVL